MTTDKFMDRIEEAKVVEAIRSVESRTTGEVRVFVASHGTLNVAADARRRFRMLKMDRTKDRNAVLFYFVPGKRQFAILGDAGIHNRVGNEFWNAVTADIIQSFRLSKITPALVSAIEKVGQELIKHFPGDKSNENQFPDTIGRD